MTADDPVVLVRSRVLKGRDADDRGIASAAADLQALLRVDAQRLGVSVDDVREIQNARDVKDVGDVSVEDGPMGAWVRVTCTVIAHARSGAEEPTRRDRL